jgi:hypothetical protein
VTLTSNLLAESEIRAELLRSLWEDTSTDDQMLLEEVGLLHGSYRADVVRLSERLAGFEIKSTADSLDRLPHQVRAYSAVFDMATAVVTANHLGQALEILPDWWGVTLAARGTGRIALIRLREPQQNPSPDPNALAALLWKSEADQLLAASVPSRRRSDAYDALAATLTWEELRGRVSEVLRLREDWLPAYSPATYGD